MCQIPSYARLALTFLPLGLMLAAPVRGARKAEKLETAQQLVQEALHCEIYGLESDRAQLLDEALELMPNYAPARWHQGYVRFQNSWVPAEEVPQWLTRNRYLRAYERLRAEHLDTVAGHMALADWCRRQRLDAQERAHLTRVLDLSPNHVAARVRLGFRRINGRWTTDEVLREAALQRRMDRENLAEWDDTIRKLRSQLQRRNAHAREVAERTICELQDTAAIPALEAELSTFSRETAALAVTAIAQMPGQDAVESLVRHAVLAPWQEIRDQATEALKTRKPESYIPRLLAEMYTPVISQVVVVPAGRDQIAYRHSFLRDAEDERQQLWLDTLVQRVALPGGDREDTLRRALRQTAAAANSREQLVAQQNERTEELNERSARVLNETTGQQLPASPELWWQWWNDQNDVLVPGGKQTRALQLGTQVAVADQATAGLQLGNGGGGRQTECFAAGTLVWTGLGQRAIEDVQVGDLVLSQDVESGELAFHPVLRTTVRPAEPLLEVKIGDETFRTTRGHLFWVAGQGWTRARELTSGMQIHSVAGAVPVISLVGESDPGETYNLVVDRFHNYFVGRQRILSHDVEPRQPTQSVVPGLRDD
jgi:hypothetical protein